MKEFLINFNALCGFLILCAIFGYIYGAFKQMGMNDNKKDEK